MVALTLQQRGHVAYFAGGCVRDRLLGSEPADYDIATDATPAQIKAIFPRAYGVGEAFGVMLLRRHRYTIELATFRSDAAYSDGRRPDRVHFSDARHDALRRDFTINGVFENPADGEIIDFVGGRSDLEAGVVRAIGDPEQRLTEDRLRMLRAVRFAARLGFEIEAATDDAIVRGAERLQGVSRERVGHEIRRMLSHPTRVDAVRLVETMGLDSPALDEPHMQRPSVILQRLAEQATVPAALAAWLLDRHGPDREVLLSRIKAWRRALKLSNQEFAAIVEIIDILGLFDQWETLTVAGRKRLAARKQFNQAICFLNASKAGRIRDETSELAKSDLSPEPLITGDDLIAMGLTPGPAFRDLLDAVYDAQLEGRVNRHHEARELVKRLTGENPEI